MKRHVELVLPLLLAACGAPPPTATTHAADSVPSPDTSHCGLIEGDNHGGRVVDSPRIFSLFWGGGFWNDSSSAGGAAMRDQIDQAWRFIGNHRLFYSALVQYGIFNPGSYGGLGVIPFAPPSTVNDGDIQAQVQSWIDAHPGDDDDERTIYVVYLPQGVTSVKDAGLGGHHDHFFDAASGKLIVYAPIPWAGNIDNYTLYTTHEVYEAIGNPAGGRGELCDPCQTLPNRGWRWNGYLVERVYSDRDCACVSTRALATDGPAPYRVAHDYLWRNASTGAVGLWQLAAGKTVGPVSVRSYNTLSTNISSEWRIAGTGDFDGDGNGDVLWTTATTGQARVWRLAGPTTLDTMYASTVLGPRLPGGHVVAVGDFDGDGLSDVVWRDGAGTVDVQVMGAQYSGRGPTIGVPPVWQILGVGDFDGDSRSDLLWRNTSTGQLIIWFMNGDAAGRAAWVDSGGLGLAYLPTIGRFAGNTTSDIVWRSQLSGDTVAWMMNGERVVRTSTLANAGPDWDLVASGDIDGDGQDDLVWRNNRDGSAGVWLMNDLSVSYMSPPSPGVPPDWALVGTVADGT